MEYGTEAGMEYGSEAEMEYGSDAEMEYGSDAEMSYGDYGDYGDYGSQDDAGTVDEWESIEYVSEDEYANTFAQVQTSESDEDSSESCWTGDTSCQEDAANGLAQEETGSDDDVSLTPSEEEAAEALLSACGEPEDSDDEEWGECFCDFIGGCSDLASDE